MAEIKTKYLGLMLKNPIIVGSSGLTNSIDNVLKMEQHGAAAVVLKSLFEEEIVREMQANLKKMASNSFIYPESLEFYEHQEDKTSSGQYLDLVATCKKQCNIPIIPSINCVSARQWTYFPKQLQEAGADAIELNLFFLPSDINRSAEDNEKLYFEIISEVKKQISVPLAIKISPYFSNLAQMIQKISEAGADSIVLFNRFYSPDFDINDLVVTSTEVLSKPEDMANTLRWIALMSGRVKCDLAATTGIHDGAGLVKQLLAGANAVQVVSSIYNHGPKKIGDMILFLKNWMDTKQFSTLSDFSGKMNQSGTDNPAAFERVQFMKYFRGYKH